MSNVLHSSKTVEWYTPPEFIEAARRVMGSIDLDPASCEFANTNFVKASKIFTKEDDGLAQEWFGNVFLNMPYGKGEGNKSNQEIWSQKLIREFGSGRVSQAIMLVNAVPDRRWFQPLWRFPICFVSPRIRFIDSSGKQQSGPTHGNCFVYFGGKYQEFNIEFSNFGHVVGL